MNRILSLMLVVIAAFFLNWSYPPVGQIYLSLPVILTLAYLYEKYFGTKSNGYLAFLFLVFFSLCKILYTIDFSIVLTNRLGFLGRERFLHSILASIYLSKYSLLIIVIYILCLGRLGRYFRSSAVMMSFTFSIFFILVEFMDFSTFVTSLVIPILNQNFFNNFLQMGGHYLAVFCICFVVYLILNSILYNKFILTCCVVIGFASGLLLIKFIDFPVKKKSRVQAVAFLRNFSTKKKNGVIAEDFEKFIEEMKSKKFQASFYFWPEANLNMSVEGAFLETLKNKLAANLPGVHFIGIFENPKESFKGFGANQFFLIDTKSSDTNFPKILKSTLLPFEEDIDVVPWLSEQKYLSVYRGKSSNKFGVLNFEGIKFSAFLCNEVLDLRKILAQNILDRSDIILNPSNIPQFLGAGNEKKINFMDEYIARLAGKPVIKISSSGTFEAYAASYKQISDGPSFKYFSFEF